jgi:tetratricopeptide (TPR) repeat protein
VNSRPISQPFASFADKGFLSCLELKYVRRNDELRLLKTYLDNTKSGNFQLCFVTGEAGSGKTAMINEFIRKAQDDDHNLVAAIGNCNAQIGEGDPYLPFMELLSQLTNQMETKLEEEGIINTNAEKVKGIMKSSAKVLLTHAPGIISTFLPLSPLAESIAKTAIGHTGIIEKLDRDEEEKGFSKEIDKDRIFQEYTDLLSVLSKYCPLVLVIDNLQWADSASLDLFLHLCYRLKNSKILLIGTYRPDDVALGRRGDRHPLMSIISNLKRYFGDIWIDLHEINEEERRAFVSDLIDCEPNLLGPDFRESLFYHTAGHPLFTVELIKGLKEEGDLVKDQQGRWIASDKLDWNVLPARVEGVFEERMGRLEEDLRDILTVASVEGMDFTAQVLCQIEKLQERDLLKRLSRDLEKSHRLIKEGNTERIGQNWLSHYSFSQALFQQYLYDMLTLRERAILHEDIAETLEVIYSERLEAVSVRLAHHYGLAGRVEKAVEYRLKSAHRALRVSAYEEALGHLRNASDLVITMQKGDKRDSLDLDIQIYLSSTLKATMGFDSPEVFLAYSRARDLCRRLGQTSKLPPILFGLWTYHLYKLNLKEAYEISRECLDIGTKMGEKSIIMEAHVALGNTQYWFGKFSDSYDHMQQVLQLYDPQNDTAHVVGYGMDPRVVALLFSSLVSSITGHMDRAIDERNKMLSIADELSHPFSTAIALQGAAILDYHINDFESALKHTEILIDLSIENKLPSYIGIGTMIRGWALSARGDRMEGIKLIDEGYNKWLAGSGGRMCHSMYCLMLAEAYGDDGDIDNGLQVLEKGLTEGQLYGELCYETELYRKKAELLLKQGDLAGADSNLRKAIEVADNKGANLFQLKATISLGRLLAEKGECDESRRILDKVYDKFLGESKNYMNIE